MSKGRTELNEVEQKALDEFKDEMESLVLHLLRVGVRPANIEIELTHHLKRLLKND